jgi:hypothetical protein
MRLVCIYLVYSALSLISSAAADKEIAALPNSAPVTPAPPANPSGMWDAHVEALLNKHCFKCHGGVKQKGGLDLRTPETVLKGGENGPALVPGRPQQSLIYKLIQPGSDPHMPAEEKAQLSASEMAVIKAWIEKFDPSVAATASKTAPLTGGSRIPSPARPRWIPPSNLPPSDVIDRFIELGWKEREIEPTGLCSDRTFVRRIFLDLAGRIPALEEMEAVLGSSQPEKRATLVDRLLAGPDYPRRMREVFDVVLMERRGENFISSRQSNKWFDFLESSFRENRPWKQTVHDMILARPSKPEERGAVWFLYERKDNFQLMAEAVAPVAFGTQVKCAQCHNHPLADEIEQRHYWALVAAFNRSKTVDTPDGPGLSESAIGGFVNFTNLKKESQPAILAFLNGKTVEEKRPAENAKEEDLPENYLVPPPPGKGRPSKPSTPKFSRRAELAEAVTRDNPLLARAFVNRVWALLLGRGFVHPVDEMNSRHPASHPELLDWLAADFERSNYDIKRLIRNIVLSRAYQLDSRPASDVPPAPEAFAYGLEKPLSAEALYRSLLIATGNQADADGKVAGRDEKEIRQAFVAKFPDLFAEEYNASLQQALFLSNNPLIEDLLKPRSNNTTARLLTLPDAKKRARQAFATVFGRRPDTDELEQAVKFLAARPSQPEASVRELLWALLSSAEFQMNH